MIRPSRADDGDEITRLALAQFARLPWDPTSMAEPTGILVCDRSGYELTGALTYFVGSRLYVTYLWVDDGFRGYRAAVELCRAAEKLSLQLGKRLSFEIPIENVAFAKVVEGAGYVPKSKTYEAAI